MKKRYLVITIILIFLLFLLFVFAGSSDIWEKCEESVLDNCITVAGSSYKCCESSGQYYWASSCLACPTEPPTTTTTTTPPGATTTTTTIPITICSGECWISGASCCENGRLYRCQ